MELTSRLTAHHRPASSIRFQAAYAMIAGSAIAGGYVKML